ncbi:MAG: hypothetical protein OXT67_01820 [Zetaproteobacteria bacterium]|nr:hypothetical protein [Zetaproteobacteria bacterium]
MDVSVSEILKDNISEIQKLNRLTECVHEKLAKLYIECFPKVCATCGREYNNIEDYREQTQGLPRSNMSFNEKYGLAEYRNCVCGSTLLIITQDRRDRTYYGDLRRELFDQCLQHIMKTNTIRSDQLEDVKERLRRVFADFS